MTFAEIVDAMAAVEKAKHVVVCPVGEQQKVETLIQRYDMGAFWTAKESRLCPADTLYLIKEPPVFGVRI